MRPPNWLVPFDSSATTPPAPGDGPPVTSKHSKTFFGVKLSQLVGAQIVSPGAQLVSINSGWPAAAIVNDDGTVTFGESSSHGPFQRQRPP